MSEDQGKNPPDELQHFGVKGMKWGVRKKDPSNPGYSQYRRDNDARLYGKGTVRRINRRMNTGAEYKDARRKEVVRQRLRKDAAVIGSLAAARYLSLYGTSHIKDLQGYIATKAAQNRDAAKVAESLLGIASKSEPLKYAKPRRGAYKITTLK